MYMKTKFETVFNGLILLLVVVLLGAVWADAQTATNPPPTNTISSHVSSLRDTFDANKQFLLTFGLNRISMLSETMLFGMPLWKYLSFGIYVFLAWLASRLMDYLFQVVMKRWAEKTESKLDDLLIELMHGPVKVITFVILLHVGLNIFDWPAWVTLYLSKGLKLIVAWSVTYMAVKAVDILMQHLRNRAKEEDRTFDAQLFPVISKFLKIFIVLVAMVVTAQNLEFNITGILASLSIGGLAIGLAAQDTLANLFGAVAIFADKPFRVGDRIQLDAIDGNVEKIGLRSTRVRNLDGYLVTIPNKTMGSATVTNVSLRPNIRTVMNVGLTYDSGSKKVKQALVILEEIYRQHPQTEDVIIGFNKFGDSALNIQVIHWWKGVDYKVYLAGMQELNLAVMDKFEAAGIEMAFPTQTLYLKKEKG